MCDGAAKLSETVENKHYLTHTETSMVNTENISGQFWRLDLHLDLNKYYYYFYLSYLSSRKEINSFVLFRVILLKDIVGQMLLKKKKKKLLKK